MHVAFTDDFDGIIADLWTNKSSPSSSISYGTSQLRLYSAGGMYDGANALSAQEYKTAGQYELEFDWWPLPAASWREDQLSHATCQVAFCDPNPAYNGSAWGYQKLASPSSYVYLRSEITDLVTVMSSSYGFNYTAGPHRVKITLDFDTETIGVWMDGVFKGSATMWDSHSSKFVINIHWNSFEHWNTMLFDSMTLKSSFLITEAVDLGLIGLEGRVVGEAELQQVVAEVISVGAKTVDVSQMVLEVLHDQNWQPEARPFVSFFL